MLQLALLLIASLLSLCVAEVFHVNATHPASPDQSCPQPCYTVDQYAQNTSLFAGHTNISLVFLDGVHILNSTLNLSEINEISLQPQAYDLLSENSLVVIRAKYGTKKVMLFGQKITVCNILFESTDIQIGPGSISHNKRSVFATLRECVILYGGIHITDAGSKISKFHVKITSSCLEGNYTESVDVRVLTNLNHSKGVNAKFVSQGTSNCTLSIHNSSITKYAFGIMAFSLGHSTVTISNTLIYENAVAGYIYSDNELTHSIDNSTIFKNHFTLSLSFLKTATIRNSKLFDNVIGMLLINCNTTLEETQVNSNDLGVVIESVRLPKEANTNSPSPCHKKKVVFQDCTFKDNRGSPIVSSQSSIQLTGENIFSNNTAEMGAGLALYYSTVHFGSHSKTTFVNNTAKQYGGAIYISSLPPLTPAILTGTENWQKEAFSGLYTITASSRRCFYSHKDWQTKVIFRDNKAKLGGEDIFGPSNLFESSQ